jgi:hypothetical protein
MRVIAQSDLKSTAAAGFAVLSVLSCVLQICGEDCKRVLLRTVILEVLLLLGLLW